MSYKSEPIAIIGSACRFPGGSNTTSKLWELIKTPRDISQKIPSTRFNVDTFYHPEATHHGTTNAPKGYFLDEDVANFDAAFFNMGPTECDSADPQQRLLMETVYDSLCAAGLPLEKLRGSPTAVFVGMMCDDWNAMVSRDWESMPTYAATGLARSIVSNRISYFFDWHGPSMTIDTACSSSLVSVHQAVQTLRSGESTVAIAAGTNLILSPTMYISETNLRMLSPSGRCAMWDVAADGYARGEGVAAVVLKTLSQALADGDPIESIIRETGINQDGRTTGLTMPSNIAQASLIRDTYRRAGLDINDPRDRPQFFHAHGTGTQAGDPQESEAISSALFPNGSIGSNKLYVGSIKTVIGHTEGTAGLAALIGTSLAMRHNTIPPNLHFSRLSPKVAPFYENLEIPTITVPWPELAQGCVKRASINSFGFGGTNAHAIIESYEQDSPAVLESSNAPLFTPMTFSAASEKALKKTLAAYAEYVLANPGIDLRDLAWTLQTRRSTLPFRSIIAAPTLKVLSEKLEVGVNGSATNTEEPSVRYLNVAEPKILGVFTGQGAQWPRMGAVLIESSEYVRERIEELDSALQSLPFSDRPTWTIKDQLLAGKETSRIGEAVISQPLCLAVQIILVDILREAGIKFTAVVGHSSGEMGAAYASGLIAANDAIRIAYYRGLHAKRAASPMGSKGAMMAVGTSHSEAIAICELEPFQGRVQVAAVNSGSSITLSGDEDAIDKLVEHFKAEQVFNRKLQVDTAYHSAHMKPCAASYLDSMGSCNIQKQDGHGPLWFSSVKEGLQMSKESLDGQYWVDNMCETVLFASALTHAISESGPFDLILEVGPHAALKGPATATIEAVSQPVPYTSCLSRFKDDATQLSEAFGYIWTHLGSGAVDFAAVERLLSGVKTTPSTVPDLPAYPFDHQRAYWTGSRVTNHHKYRQTPPNPILGTICAEGATSRELQWRNILRSSETSWLEGHKLQGQVVFPATGYVSMAVEAMKYLAGKSDISLFQIQDLEIGRAISFNDEGASVETLFSVCAIETSNDSIIVEFACHSILPGDSAATLNAKGRASVQLATSAAGTLPVATVDSFNLVEVDKKQFYANLAGIGYNYSLPFQGVSHIKRKPDYSTGLLQDQSGHEWEDNLTAHPGMLDTALQTAFAAWSFPGDGRLWSLHVPTKISSICVNPYFTPLGLGKQTTVKFEAFIHNDGLSRNNADIHLYTPDGLNCFVQIEGMSLVPFTPASAAHDTALFADFQYKVSVPDGKIASKGETFTEHEAQLYSDIDRVAYWYIRDAVKAAGPEQRDTLLDHLQKYLQWCDRIIGMVSRNELSKVPSECNSDTRENVITIINKYDGQDRDIFNSVKAVGENLPNVFRERSGIPEHMNHAGLQLESHENFIAGPNTRWLSRIISQIAHRYPSINILEIGAGTGATASSIMSNTEAAFSSYTFTDKSDELFSAAEERLKEFSSRMVFKIFDMENEPNEQGFDEGQYDVIVASNVLHLAQNKDQAMENVRRLLKPGGYLIALEVTSTELLFSGMIAGTRSEWWRAADTKDPWGPVRTLDQWDSLLKKTGFSGVDTTTPDISVTLPVSVFVAQAVDDRVTMLRNPLNSSENESPLESLIIIGGTTAAVEQLAEDILELVTPRYKTISAFENVEDYSHSEQAQKSGTTILNLTDLDEPFMKTFTREKFDALKILFNNARAIVWVTQRSRRSEPYSYMMLGVGRTVKSEYLNMSLQMFDIESIQDTTAHLLSESVIRHQLLSSWDADPVSLLWSTEPEIMMEDSHALVTRVLPNEEKNNRYNSRRRIITRRANPETETLRLVGAGKSFAIQETSPLRQHATADAGASPIRITHSLLQSVRVGDAGFLRIAYGVNVASQKPVLALLGSSESPAVVPAQWCVELDAIHSPSSLVAIAANVIAERVVSAVPKSGTLLVHEPDTVIKSAIKARVAAKNIKVVFTTSQQNADGNDWRHIHLKASQQQVRKLIPSSIAAFVHFSKGSQDNGRQLILNVLPRQCICIEESDLLSNEVHPVSGESEDLTELLNSALAAVDFGSSEESNLIPLDAIAAHCATGEPLATVDWTSGPVSVEVQPIDSHVSFRPDVTYLFVGLAGEIGQFLCQWMVARGAKHIVLSSRTPKVNPKFIEVMAEQGAEVKAIPLDITSRQSLRRAYKTIVSTMPSIAGVINGAMVLQDDLFDNMTHAQFAKVTRPKVIGTELLDELFYNTPLDFFVVTSSISAVTGHSGQSNYSGANSYMTSLMYQRKERGVAGSAMVVPAVSGIGYAAQDGNFDFEYAKTIGFINISEQDFCILFAEAVLSGHPESQHNAEVVSGINYVAADLQVKASHRRDIKFSHYIRDMGHSLGVRSSNADVRVKIQLETVKTKSQAYSIIQGKFQPHAFVIALKRVLQIPQEDAMDVSVALIEQGVDSLVAVEVRSWFLREVEVDIPVLKILGGSSVADLLRVVYEKIPATVLKLDAVETEKPKIKEASLPPLKPAYFQANSSSSSGSSPVSTPISTPGEPYVSSAGSSSGIPSPPRKFLSESGGLSTDQMEKTRRALILGKCSEIQSQMSFGQSRFWFLHQFLEDKTAFNFSFSACITGRLNLEAFENAINLVLQRHDALRTRFFWSNGDTGTPMQGVLSRPLTTVETKDISSAAEAATELQVLQNHTYDIEDWGAVRVQLLTLSNNVHYFLMGCHHIALDGQSTHVLMAEVVKMYQGEVLPPIPAASQYAAFAAQQRQDHDSGLFQKHIDFFRHSIGKAPGAIELFPFAEVRARKAMLQYKQHRAALRLDAKFATRVKRFAQKLRCTNFHVYMSVLQTLVFRLLPETNEFCVGIADSNRVDKNFINTIGCLVNLLPIKFERNMSQRFVDAVKLVRGKVYAALEHSKVPFDVLLGELGVVRSAEYNPIFQVFMDYRQGDREHNKFDSLDAEVAYNHSANGYDLQLEVADTANGESLLVMKLQDSLYSQAHTELLLGAFVNLLDQLSQDTSSDILLSTPSLWAQSDIERAFQVGKGPAMGLEWASTTVHRVDKMIKAHPSRTALKDGRGHVLTYVQMKDRSNSIAVELLKIGVSKGDVVALFQEPSADWMCSMLAIFRVGATYMPLDLKNGMPRLSGSVSVGKPRFILVDRYTAELVPSLHLRKDAVTTNVSSIITQIDCHVPNFATADGVAAIIFTSGSTGAPKGVILSHSCLVANAEATERSWNVGANTVLQQSTLSFDFSLHQILTAFTNGGTLYVVPPEKRGDPVEITDIILKEKITCTIATPTEYGMWLQLGRETLAKSTTWKWAISGGEALSKPIIQGLAALDVTGLRFCNTYGPVEATIALSMGEVFYRNIDLEKPIPTGYVLPTYSVYILDENLNPLPVGVPGEVVVGGPGLSDGYLDLHKLTSQKFIANPFHSTETGTQAPTRLYRTGDRGRLDMDGRLFHEGRINGDRQVKLNGIRVELEEVEAAIISTAKGAVKQVVVSIRAEPESKLLVAYVVLSEQAAMYGAQFVVNLRAALPIAQYMRPAVFVPLQSIPVSPHGKTDLIALSQIPLPSGRGGDIQTVPELEALTDTERRLGDLWTRILPPQGVDLHAGSDFFHMGGNSLLLVNLQRLLKDVFHAAPRLVDLISASTLHAMSKVIESTTTRGSVNWDLETAVPDSWPSVVSPVKSIGKNSLTIVLTGATGYLGRHLLSRLVADSRVVKIVCLVRSESRIAISSPKISTMTCNLAEPNLGLSSTDFTELSQIADVIIHCAANRSFWDDYEVLRPVNFNSVKDLARLALQRGVPLHFFSSGAVSMYDGTVPAADGGDGYIATKWASERLLHNVARQLNLPVCIHSPNPAPVDKPSVLDPSVIGELVDCAERVGHRPDFNGFSGHIDLIDTAQFLDTVCHVVFDGLHIIADTRIATLGRVPYDGVVRLNIDDSRATVNLIQRWISLPTMDLLAWMGQAKAHGFPFVLSSQNLTMTSGSRTIVSRR